MLHSYLDHLVVTAPSLDAGVNYVQHKLGIRPQSGGDHIQMGTHNALLKLGPSIYLEVIAINSELTKPNRPRWFSLDSLLPDSQPTLRTWVARTNDIYSANKVLKADGVENMSRGEWNWLITLNKDGSMLCDGVAPLLIQWLTQFHPASKLPDVGCALVHLNCYHPNPDNIKNILNSIGLNGDFFVIKTDKSVRPFLSASIQTPKGIIEFN